eukprot:CAMPEP_0119321086 /NCGR_PEP_ID=MMETSP1333-20130426/54376_1 /TAXON_ID=418940 /ORGANISM="Scyphosphaera apsteinii, Strain RCC1455" /LENGTH=266 /DNA_ID=CAMNT_0007327963 /DNA_START=182 /DNA_END=979 /DNA_ORIENTATION=+
MTRRRLKKSASTASEQKGFPGALGEHRNAKWYLKCVVFLFSGGSFAAAAGLLSLHGRRGQKQGSNALSMHPHAYVSSYEVIEVLPHDPRAFTQGLVFDNDGTLYESDGLFGRSVVRSVDLLTGKSERSTKNADDEFGEGIAILDNRLMQLTWKNKVVLEYELPSLKLLRSVSVNIGAEGWGLATNGTTLFMTDSEDSLFFVEPVSYALLDKKVIRDPKLGGKQVFGVNELEYVAGEIWGNIFPMYQHKSSECIVRLNASTGQVIGW